MKAVVRMFFCLCLTGLFASMIGCVGGKTPEALPEAKGVKRTLELRRPLGVAVDSKDRRIVANTGMNQVLVLDRNYEPIGTISGRTKGGLLKEPHDVCCDSKDRIIVADTGNNRVNIYDENGYFKTTIGSEGSGPVEFRSPEGVTTDKDDNIFVFDTGNKRVQVFTRSGKYIFEFSSGTYSYDRLEGSLEEPKVTKAEGEITLDHPVRGTAMPDNRLVVADYRAGRYSVWTYDIKGKTATPLQFVEPMDNYEDYLAGDVVYNPVQNELFYLRSGFPLTNVDFLRVAGIDSAASGKVPGEYAHLKDDPYEWTHFYRTNGALKTRFFEPRGVAVDTQGNAVVALAVQNKVVEISRREIDEGVDRLHPPAMRIVETNRDSVVIEYKTLEEVETRFQYGELTGSLVFGEPPADEVFTEVYADRALKKHHRVDIYDLFPETRYVFRYVNSVRSFPKPNFTNPFVVATEPERGSTAYLDLPITVLLFTNIIEPLDEERLQKDGEGNVTYPEDPGQMTEEEVQRVMDQMEVARLFYWVNSRMKMNMKFNFIIDDTRHEGVPFGKWAYYPDKDRIKLDEILRGHGVEPKGIGGGVCVVYGTRKYNYEKAEWFMPGSGGNTWALPHDGSGISVWNAGGDNAWLFAHEYGHQLGIMGNNCGHVYHFNHFHWNDLPGDYGGHWDGNAYIAREFKPSSYLANFYGSLATSLDSDSDGIPDDDPNVPLDEKRFGTRTYSADSDNDGLGDRDEIMSAMWLFDTPTVGVRMVGPIFKPSPHNDDTDEDGIPDGRDPYPLYPISTKAAENGIIVDGVISDGEWARKTTRAIEDVEASGSFHVNWDGKYLYFGLVLKALDGMDQPPLLRIEIDGNNDGFTVGSDNLTITTVWDPEKNDLAVKTNYNDTSVRKQPVWKNNLIPKPDDVRVAWQKSEDLIAVEIAVPQTPEAGLNLFTGEEIGFNFAFKLEGAENWLILFEPQQLVDITLE